MASQLHEAVAASIVREGKDELILLSPKEREETVNQILQQVSQKSDDELISFVSSKKKNVSPELRGKIAEMETLKSRIGAVSGGEIEFIMGKQQDEADLQKMGIVTRRDLPVGSTEIGFSDSPAKTIKSELSKFFSEKLGKEVDVPVFNRDEDLLYLDPQTNEVVKVNPTMMQNIGLSMPIAGDIAGTIGGGIVGGKLSKTPKGVIAGESAGAFVGTSTMEFARLYIGKVMGAHELSWGEMAKKSGVEGVKAGAATAVMGGLMATGKGIRNFLSGGIFTKDEALKHGMNSKEAEAILEEVNKLIGRKGAVKGTLGRLSDDVIVKSKEAEVRRLGEHAQKFIDRDLADQKALTEAMDIITKPSKAKGGEAIAEVAAKQTSGKLAKARGIVSENVTQLKKELDNIGKVSSELVGKPTRETLLAKSDAAKKAQESVWNNMKADHGFDPKEKIFNIKIPRGKGAVQLAKISKRRAETAQVAGVRSAESKGLVLKPKMADLEDYNFNISLLRKDIRAAEAGRQAGDATTASLSEIKNTLIEDRRVALIKAGKGKLLKDIETAEKATANYYETYRRSVIGDLTKKKDGVFAIKEKDFVTKTLKGSKEEADQLLAVIGDSPTLMATWKEGIADAYKSAAFKGEKFNREASTKFIRAHRDVLDNFFDPKDLAKLEKTGNLAEKVTKQNDQLKELVANANKRWGKGKLKSMDTNNIVKFVTNDTGSFVKGKGDTLRGVQSSIAKIKYIKGMTKNYPAAWKSFQDEFSTQLRKSVIDINAGFKAGYVSPKALNKTIHDQENEIIEIMGQGYFNNLVKVNKAVQQLNTKELKLISDEAKQGILAVIRAVAAPPLTRRGRALTASNIFLSKQGHKVIADSLLDPNTIRKVAELSEHKRLTREAAELAVSLGFIGEEDGN